MQQCHEKCSLSDDDYDDDGNDDDRNDDQDDSDDDVHLYLCHKNHNLIYKYKD